MRHRIRRFADEAARRAYLKRRGIGASHELTTAAQLASKDVLWGSITDHGLLTGEVIVSDGASQLKVDHHTRCWVHAKRLIHSQLGFTEAQQVALERIMARVWWFYADLKAHGRDSSVTGNRALSRRFDRIFTARTAFVTLDCLLARLHATRDDLLVALERWPRLPRWTSRLDEDLLQTRNPLRSVLRTSRPTTARPYPTTHR